MEMKNAIHAICNPRACCVTTNHSKDQGTQTSQKKNKLINLLLRVWFLMCDWLFSCITFKKYFWCSWFSSFDCNLTSIHIIYNWCKFVLPLPSPLPFLHLSHMIMCGCFLVLQNPMFVHFCAVVWILFSFLSVW